MKLKGLIFDISRFSLHDGEGIRTTVFIKGCPLRCIWCHNPESQSYEIQLQYDESKCIHCLECVKQCPNGVHQFISNQHIINYNRCNHCGACYKACPSGALTSVGRWATVEEILNEVEKDKIYYERSGGGLTLSGGEPMSKIDFTLALLKESKSRGISICMETSGYAKVENFEKVLPFVNLFLFDYKETSEENHKKLTGVSNRLILSNLDYLYNNGALIILRCPIIPEINDSISHFEGIAQLTKKYPNLLKIQLMPYNNLGLSKNKKIGCPDYFKGRLPTEEEKKNWINILKELGSNSVEIG